MFSTIALALPLPLRTQGSLPGELSVAPFYSRPLTVAGSAGDFDETALMGVSSGPPPAQSGKSHLALGY